MRSIGTGSSRNWLCQNVRMETKNYRGSSWFNLYHVIGLNSCTLWVTLGLHSDICLA